MGKYPPLQGIPCKVSLDGCVFQTHIIICILISIIPEAIAPSYLPMPPPYPLTPSENCSQSRSPPQSCRHFQIRGEIGLSSGVFFIVECILNPAPSPFLSLNSRCKRTISSNAAAVASKAKAEEDYGKRLRMTKPIPSYLSPPHPHFSHTHTRLTYLSRIQGHW